MVVLRSSFGLCVQESQLPVLEGSYIMQRIRLATHKTSPYLLYYLWTQNSFYMGQLEKQHAFPQGGSLLLSLNLRRMQGQEKAGTVLSVMVFKPQDLDCIVSLRGHSSPWGEGAGRFQGGNGDLSAIGSHFLYINLT